jgi:hypothetical protein
MFPQRLPSLRESPAMIRRFAVLVALLLAAPAPAGANDTMAVGAAGGLVFVKSADVAMETEDLWISPEQIRVRYAFRNRGKVPVEALIAFPLPVFDHAAERVLDPDVQTTTGDFVEFTVTVDGKPVQPKLEMRAWLGETEVTAALAEAGLPLSRFVGGPRLAEAIEDLPEATRQKLAAAGILGPGEMGDFDPQWAVRSTYHWPQRFAPGRRTIVEHRYKPVVGSNWLLREEAQAGTEWAEYCIEPALRTALMTRLGPNDVARVLLVDYVLSTGANWAGPIGRFRLTIDKGTPGRLLSTCLEGLKKTGATTWMLERRNFTPESDLRLMIIEEPPPAE